MMNPSLQSVVTSLRTICQTLEEYAEDEWWLQGQEQDDNPSIGISPAQIKKLTSNEHNDDNDDGLYES